MLLEVQVCASGCFAILDELIGNEVEEVWRELGIEREVSELMEELDGSEWIGECGQMDICGIR